MLQHWIRKSIIIELWDWHIDKMKSKIILVHGETCQVPMVHNLIGFLLFLQDHLLQTNKLITLWKKIYMSNKIWSWRIIFICTMFFFAKFYMYNVIWYSYFSSPTDARISLLFRQLHEDYDFPMVNTTTRRKPIVLRIIYQSVRMRCTNQLCSS